MLAAVQIYNNPSISFKAESFITLAVISWTYLMHAYYRKEKNDYRYYDLVGKRKKYQKTKHGAYKHWKLDRCLNYKSCPLDKETGANLKFLIGIRHEVEHQMTDKIDEYLSAKLQACAINYDYHISRLFGEKYSMHKELSLAIQFSPLSPAQQDSLIGNSHISSNVRNSIVEFEDELDEEILKSSKYAYRVLFVPVNAKRIGQADQVIEFIKSDSPLAEGIEKQYAMIKETEKPKYRPSEIVKIMQEEGYQKFSISKHTDLWKAKDAKSHKNHYGTYISNTWYWYQTWVDFVMKHCDENADKYR